MLKKIAPLMIMGMAAQDYYNKSGKEKKKNKKLEKAAAKKKMQKSKKTDLSNTNYITHKQETLR